MLDLTAQGSGRRRWPVLHTLLLVEEKAFEVWILWGLVVCMCQCLAYLAPLNQCSEHDDCWYPVFPHHSPHISNSVLQGTCGPAHGHTGHVWPCWHAEDDKTLTLCCNVCILSLTTLNIGNYPNVNVDYVIVWRENTYINPAGIDVVWSNLPNWLQFDSAMVICEDGDGHQRHGHVKAHCLQDTFR